MKLIEEKFQRYLESYSFQLTLVIEDYWSSKTQYSNMESESDKFYIPENVYIIGTMNDIDRSVDTFDFAMRRRFRFIEIEANENIEMLESLGDKKRKLLLK